MSSELSSSTSQAQQPQSPSPAAANTEIPSSASALARAHQAGTANAPHLNVSLQDLKKQHQANLQTLKANAQKAHQKVGQTVSNVAILTARDANVQLQEIFQNEQQLEQQIKELATQSEHFRKRVQQWSGHFVKLNQAMKEIGDVHNWSQSIHKDIDATLTVLDEVSAKKRRVLGIGSTSASSSVTPAK